MRNITFSQDFFSFLEERKQNHSINIHWNHRWYMRRKNSIHWPQWADTTQVNPDRTEPPAGDTFGHWEREELHMTSRSTLKCSDAESHRSTASVGYLLSLSSESPRGLRMEMAGEDEGYWNRGESNVTHFFIKSWTFICFCLPPHQQWMCLLTSIVCGSHWHK